MHQTPTGLSADASIRLQTEVAAFTGLHLSRPCNVTGFLIAYYSFNDSCIVVNLVIVLLFFFAR